MIPKEHFNVIFYKLMHKDLSHFDDEELWDHYQRHGVQEGRAVMDMRRPLLQVYTTTFKEPFVLKDLIDFYRKRVPDCIITVRDNESNDEITRQIAEDNNCEFRTFSTDGKMDESVLMQLRNGSWKTSNAIYVIVVDSDELIDINKDTLMANLLTFDWYACKCKGYELFGTSEEDSHFFGSPSAGYSKQALFIKDLVAETNYGAGSHSCDFIIHRGLDLKLMQDAFNLYHTKWQNWKAGLERQKLISARRSPNDIKNGWNYHYSLPEESHQSYWNNGFKNSFKIKEKL